MNLFQNWFAKPQPSNENDAVFIARINNGVIDFFLDGNDKEDIMNLLLSLTLGQYIEGCLENYEQKYPGFTKEYQDYLQSIETQIKNNRKDKYISPLE